MNAAGRGSIPADPGPKTIGEKTRNQLGTRIQLADTNKRGMGAEAICVEPCGQSKVLNRQLVLRVYHPTQ